MRKLINILLFMLALPGWTYAACRVTYPSTAEGTLSFGDVIVQRDAPIGSTIATKSAGAPNFQFECGAGESAILTLPTGIFNVQSSTNYAYKTNIEGVGIELYSTEWTPEDAVITGPRSVQTGLVLTARLKKIGNIPSAGVMSSGTLVSYVGTNGLGVLSKINIIGARVTPVACSIKNSNFLVPLDDVLTGSMTSEGATAKPKTFDVGLECDAGSRINVKLTGAKNTDTYYDGVLQLSNAGSTGVASGVGIQILYNGSPMRLDNNFVLKTSAGGQESFPFTVQYFRTRAPLNTGSANATATLELTYQ